MKITRSLAVWTFRARIKLIALILFLPIFFSTFTLYTYTRPNLNPLSTNFLHSTTPDTAHAATTASTLNFQGRLLNASGSLVPDGYYNIQFNLYHVSSGGSTLWTETHDYNSNSPDRRVRVVNGYFSVLLGNYDSLADESDVNWQDDVWLGMTVRGSGTCSFAACTPADSEMTPRFKLSAVPFALNSANVKSSNTNAASTNSDAITIQSGNAAGSTSNSGNITIDVGTATQTAGSISIGTTNNTTAITIGKSTGTSSTTINSGSGNIILQSQGTSTSGVIQIGVGGAGSGTPDFLALDVKDTTGDPGTTVEGYMYYNTFDNKFRCYQGSAWTDCIGSGGGTLQNAYDASTNPEITVDATRGALTVRDNASAIGANLFEVQSNGGGTTYLGVAATGTTINGNLTQSTGAVSLTGNAASSLTTSSGALTITSAAAATWSTSAGNLTIQAAGTSTVSVDTAGAGTATLGGTNATTVTVGNTTPATATTLQGGTGASAIGIQAGSGGTISIGTSNNNNVTINSAATTGTFAVGGTATTGTITLGQATTATTSTVNISSANGTASTQTVNIGAGTSTTSGGKVVNIATGTPGAGTTNTVAIGNGGAATGTVGVTLGSTGAVAHTTLIQGGNGATAIGIQAATSGTISLGTTNASTINIGNATAATVVSIESGTGATNLFNGATAHTINLATGAAVQTLTIGSTNTTSATSIQGGTTGSINLGSVGTSTLSSTTNIATTTNATGTQTVSIGSNANTANTLTLSAGSTGGVRLVTLGAVTANSAAFCRDTSTTILTACDSGNTTGRPFLQSGNSFGAAGVLGTNDAFALSLETNNTVRASFANGNTLYLGNADPTTGRAATPNSFTVQGTGSATAGTAAADVTLAGGAGATVTTGSRGGDIFITAGNAGGSGNNRGGNLAFDGGTPTGSGARGIISFGTSNAGEIYFGNTSNTGAVILDATSAGQFTLAGFSNAAVNIGTNAGAITGNQNINIGTSVTASSTRTITIGSTIGASTATLQAGTGGLNITTQGTGTLAVGNNAVAQTIAIGNTTGATALNLRTGTGNFSLDGVAGSTYTIGASTTTGTITIGGTAQTGNTVLGSSSGANNVNIGAGAGATTVNISNANTGGAVNIGASFTTGTITIGGTGAQTGTIALGTGTGAQTINLGTGGTGAKSVTVGSTASTGATTIQSGTGNVFLQAAGSGTTGNIQIGAGGAGSATPDLFVLDIKNTAGDPTGTAGALYYNSNTGQFKCFTSSWNNCLANTLQGAYDASTSPATINLADAKNFVINAADTATDPNIIFNLQTTSTTVGTGTIKIQDNGTDAIIFNNDGSILANNAATGTTGTSSGTGGTNVTSITLAAAGSFANGDIILVDNSGGSGQDYYTRITSGGGTTTLTVSPAVSYGTAAGYTGNATITKYTARNIGAVNTGTTFSDTNRFFQGYFLGGIVTGAGSTTYSDARIQSTGRLVIQGATNTSTTPASWGQSLILDNNVALGQNILEFRNQSIRTGSIRSDYVGNIVINGSSTGAIYLGLDEGSGGVIAKNNVTAGVGGSQIGDSFYGTTYAAFGRSATLGSAGGYAVLQDSVNTLINAVSGSVYLRSGNVDKLVVDSAGTVSLSAKNAFQSSDSWLRLNQGGAFTSGVHTPGFFNANSLTVGALYTSPAAGVVQLSNAVQLTTGSTDISDQDGAVHIGGVTNWGAGTNQNLVVHGTGGVCTISGPGNCASDARLKRNVSTLTGNLAKINQLRPVSYNWINPSLEQDTKIGFIAQEMQAIFPEFVKINNPDDPSGYLGISYESLVAPIVGAIQEQQAQISALQAGNFNNINVAGNLSTLNLNVTGSATIANLTVNSNARFNANITVAGHIVTVGNVPASAVLGASGSLVNGATVSVDGNDIAGVITITTAGTGALTAGDLAKFTFVTAYDISPTVTITPIGSSSATLQTYIGQTRTDFTLSTNTAPANGTVYKFNYHVIQ